MDYSSDMEIQMEENEAAADINRKHRQIDSTPVDFLERYVRRYDSLCTTIASFFKYNGIGYAKNRIKMIRSSENFHKKLNRSY